MVNQCAWNGKRQSERSTVLRTASWILQRLSVGLGQYIMNLLGAKLNTKLLIVTGPTCVGKTTVLRELERRSAGIQVAVTHTTRAPRVNEEDGRDYYFIDRNAFRSAQNADDFIDVTEIQGNLYGLSRRELAAPIDTGCRAVALDPPGALRISRLVTNCEVFFLLPENIKVLVGRLINRASHTEDDRDFERRVRQIHEDLRMAHHFVNNLVNTDISQTVDAIMANVD